MRFLPKRPPKTPSFREVHDELIWPARAYARQKLDADDAEDVVQQCFIDLWDAFYASGRSAPSNPRHLMFRILRRRLADYVRRALSRANLDEQHVFDLTARLEQELDPELHLDGY